MHDAAAVAMPARTAPAPRLHDILEIRTREGRIRADSRGYFLRRLLLLADIVALSIAFALAQLYGGIDAQGVVTLKDLALLAVGLPAWLLAAHVHGLYHVESRRTDHGLAEEIGPIVRMTVLWSWAVLLVWEISGLGPVSIPKIAIFWASC